MVVLCALLLGGAVTPATRADAKADNPQLLLGQQGRVREGVAPVPADSHFAPRTGGGSGMVSLQRNDPNAPEPQRPPGELGEGGGYGCDTGIDWDFGGIGEDDYLEETVDVLFYGDVKCNFYLYSIEGAAGVWDRSESFNGEDFDGDVLGVGSYVYREWDYAAYSVGGFGVRARLYHGARRVEPGVEWYLQAPEGFIWQACNPQPGLRYFICDGLGTNYLHVLIGAFDQATGLTKACRDQRAPVDVEQARVTRLAGAQPVSTQIVRLIPAIEDALTRFKRDLCAITSAGAAASFAAQRGLELWETAVTQAKNNAAGGDDRPLYWARLAMTAAFEQWRPSFAVNRGALQTTLDRAARGMTSHAFGAGTGKKVFISGFDPFGLDSAIRRVGAQTRRRHGRRCAGAVGDFPGAFRRFQRRSCGGGFRAAFSGRRAAGESHHDGESGAFPVRSRVLQRAPAVDHLPRQPQRAGRRQPWQPGRAAVDGCGGGVCGNHTAGGFPARGLTLRGGGQHQGDRTGAAGRAEPHPGRRPDLAGSVVLAGGRGQR
jgi:hypothetical protein